MCATGYLISMTFMYHSMGNYKRSNIDKSTLMVVLRDFIISLY